MEEMLEVKHSQTFSMYSSYLTTSSHVIAKVLIVLINPCNCPSCPTLSHFSISYTVIKYTLFYILSFV